MVTDRQQAELDRCRAAAQRAEARAAAALKAYRQARARHLVLERRSAPGIEQSAALLEKKKQEFERARSRRDAARDRLGRLGGLAAQREGRTQQQRLWHLVKAAASCGLTGSALRADPAGCADALRACGADAGWVAWLQDGVAIPGTLQEQVAVRLDELAKEVDP